MGCLFQSIALPLAAVIVLLWPDHVFAWGPATHIKLADDVLHNLAGLPTILAILLGRHAKDFLFGNIAADVVFAKRLSRVKQFCHEWKTAFHFIHNAPDEPSRAFAYGYLTHLAADTVAHNKYLPRQMTMTRSTVSFGHLYWELRADSTIGSHYWDKLREVLDHRFPHHELMLAHRLTDTLLPYQWNRAIFYRVNNTVSRRGWIRTMDAWYHRSRWELPDDVLHEYRRECLERAMDVLTHLERSPVTREDPNGTAALGHTRVQRKQHRKMARAGILHPHVLNEAVVRHAPQINGNSIRPL